MLTINAGRTWFTQAGRLLNILGGLTPSLDRWHGRSLRACIVTNIAQLRDVLTLVPGDREGTYNVLMSDLFKGFGSVVLGGFLGSCLASATFLAIKALMPNPSTVDLASSNVLLGARGFSPKTEHSQVAAALMSLLIESASVNCHNQAAPSRA